MLLGWPFDWFLIDSWWIWLSKIQQKNIKNPSKKWSKTRCDFGCILDGSWSDFGWIWAPSWGARWSQIGPKSNIIGYQIEYQKEDANRMAKERLHEAPPIIGTTILGPRGGIKGGVTPPWTGRRVETMLEKDQKQPLYHLLPEAGGIMHYYCYIPGLLVFSSC